MARNRIASKDVLNFVRIICSESESEGEYLSWLVGYSFQLSNSHYRYHRVLRLQVLLSWLLKESAHKSVGTLFCLQNVRFARRTKRKGRTIIFYLSRCFL